MTCCTRPAFHTAYYKWPIWPRDGEPQVDKINRVCLRCGTHWAGTVGEEKQYTRKEWDAYLEEGMKT